MWFNAWQNATSPSYCEWIGFCFLFHSATTFFSFYELGSCTTGLTGVAGCSKFPNGKIMQHFIEIQPLLWSLSHYQSHPKIADSIFFVSIFLLPFVCQKFLAECKIKKTSPTSKSLHTVSSKWFHTHYKFCKIHSSIT